MDVETLLKKLETEPLPRVLLVHGPELTCHERVYQTLKARNAMDSLAEWNWCLFEGQKDFELEPLLVELGSVSWGNEAKIVVLKEADRLLTATMEKLVDYLTENHQSNPLTIFFSRLDNRLKYVKALRLLAVEVECKLVEGDALIRYVTDHCTEQGKIMKRGTAELFLDWVGSDFLTVRQELDKLLAYCADIEEITTGHVKAIASLSPGQIANNTVFQMTDLIAQKKRKEALGVMELLLGAGEPALRILPLIDRQLRLLLAAKTNRGPLEEAAKQMGESNPYALRKVQAFAKNFSLDELMAGFAAVLHADRELKLGTPGEQVLTDLIVKLT